MSIHVQSALHEDEREAVYRFRYEIYCRGQGVFTDVADHDRQELSDLDDPGSTVFYATEDGTVVGTLRATWGADGPYSTRLEHELQVDRLTSVADVAGVVVLSRFLVAPTRRGGEVSSLLILAVAEACLERKVEIVVGDCEPHLLAYYRQLGFRPFGHLSSHATSLLIPLVLLIGDRAHLRTTDSPVLHLFPEDHCPPPTSAVLAVLEGAAATSVITGPDGLAAVERLIERADRMPTLLEGLDDRGRERLTNDSIILEFRAGDLLIGEGTATRTLYALLSGVVEVTRGDQILAVLVAGDVTGEMAMLLDRERTATVRAVSDGAALALSDRSIRSLIDTAPELAAGMLWNLSRVLASKLG